MVYTIYKYTSKTSGMSYIGATSKSRCERAGKEGRHYRDSCPFFGDAIREYGWKDFEYSVLETTESKELAERYEREYIYRFNTQWPNGYNSAIGGFAAALGCKKKRETVERMGRGHWKKVDKLTMGGELIETYDSITEASRVNGIAGGNISACCKGNTNRQSAGGFRWRYA